MNDRIESIVREWAQFHVFEDDCGYPLISPSSVVLEDLVLRLSSTKDVNEIRKEAKARWEEIPPCKGKERRLRRKETQFKREDNQDQ
jgi:hypothetical protein